MIKVLQIVSSLGGGGVEQLLNYYYSHMDRERFAFDFIVHGSVEGILEKKFRSMNSRIYHVTPKSVSLWNNICQTADIIKTGGYDIVHCHQGSKSFIPLYLARKYGVKHRIAHSHAANIPENHVKKIIRKTTAHLSIRYASRIFACGAAAGRWMWGKRNVENGRVYIMPNAIECEKFVFSPNRRNALRKEFGIEGKYVIGHVGRFTNQKNHEFLINIFRGIKKVKPDAVLMLVGNGEREDDIKRKVQEAGIESSVLFLGVRSDVADLLNAMDVFVLPSRFEGLPVSLLEAQCSGLRCVVSDKITREVAVTNLVQYVSIQNGTDNWISAILHNTDTGRESQAQALRQNGFDIATEAGRLMDQYANMIAGKG